MNHWLSSLAQGKCPDCGATDFVHGPIGGASRNYGCAKCGSWFNLTIYYGVLIPVFSERIPPCPMPDLTVYPRGPLPVALIE